MKVSPSTPRILCIGALLCASLSVTADTVKLKSGDVINGKILSESDQEIVMDVPISAGITDEKRIPKADVESVSKIGADTQAYETTKDYHVDSHSLQLAAYPAMMKPLEDFLKDFPQSSHVAEVQASLDAFKQEQARVKAGELKWANRWYNRDEVEKHKYQLGAAMSFEAMKDLAARRDYIGALNTFAQIEKNYPGSVIFPDAVDAVQTILRQTVAEMDRALAIAKSQEAQFNNGIVLVAEPQKSQMIAASQAKVQASEAALAAATRAQAKWKPILPLAPKSIADNKTAIATEAPRLAKLPVAEMRASLALTKEAEAALQNHKLAQADAKLKEAEKLWAQNERVKELSADVAALKETMKPKATPTPSPAASPAKEAKPKKWSF